MPVQSRFQVVFAGAAAGAGAQTYDAIHHVDVSEPPGGHQFVHVQQQAEVLVMQVKQRKIAVQHDEERVAARLETELAGGRLIVGEKKPFEAGEIAALIVQQTQAVQLEIIRPKRMQPFLHRESRRVVLPHIGIPEKRHAFEPFIAQLQQ